MKKLKIAIFLLLISIVVTAQTYELKKSAFDISGLISSGSTYTLADAIGQSVTGKSSSSTYIETSGILHMNFGSLLGIEEEIVEGLLPDVFCLHGSYPNPCRSMAVIRFEVPPLRDRRSDIPLLVDFFLKRFDRGCGLSKFSSHTVKGLGKNTKFILCFNFASRPEITRCYFSSLFD